MNELLHNPLPDDHYGENYLSFERWMSFVHQINALRGMSPKRVLEIGVGPGATGAMIEIAHPGCNYVSVDLDPTLKSSIRGDVRRLPFVEKTFDAAFCCQVLEHLPYWDFLTSLGEIRRVTRRRVVVSLPDIRPFIYLRARPPASRRWLPWLWHGISLPALPPRTHNFDTHGQHYWEIGKLGYPLRRVLSDIESLGWSKVRHYRMIERNYWHFFLLDRD